MFNDQYNSELEEEIRQKMLDQMENGRINPESQDTLPNGTPGETVSNVTPWLDKTGLWLANDGKNPQFKPKTPLVTPSEPMGEEEEETQEAEEELPAPVEEEEEEEISDEEIEQLVAELLEESSEDPEG
jgi:hypothetical protein